VKLIRENGTLENVMAKNPEIKISPDPDSIRKIFLEPKITREYSLNWSKPDETKVVTFLCGERDFSEDRVRKAVEKMLPPSLPQPSKTTLESYFG
jgi:flap endonuclease-1